ncbi:MAG: ycjS [Adhaeribacter sp.]|nr:ycjS [Adhaeribacter sp.]
MGKDDHMKNGISRRQFIGKAAAITAFMIVPRYVLGGKGYVAPSDMINLGFIGTGRQSGGLRNNFLNSGQAQIVAACDVYGSKLKDFTEKANKFYAEKAGQQQYLGCKPYEDFREVLARPDVDAVVIASPDHWHAVHAVRAAEAGKDIYCEKPLSLTIKEGRAMVKAARKHKRVFQTGNMQRSWKEFRLAVELVQNGYIGDIQTVKVNVGGPPLPYTLGGEPVPAGVNWDFWLGPNEFKPFHNFLAPEPSATFWARWRDYKGFGGGGMTDWGAHMFDIGQWALEMDNSGPVAIIPPDGKNYRYLTYKYANGITMTHEDFGKNNAIRFIGSKGQIDVQRGKLETTPSSLQTQVIGANEKRVYLSEDHYKNWLHAIRTREKPICDVEVGHRTATVCTLGNIAYELKRPLTWNPKKEKFKNDKEANALRSRQMRPEWAIKV